MRFASNGYPSEYVRVFEYNSLNSGPEVVQPALDAFIDDVLAEFGSDHLYVLGHSLGTSVMQSYLNSSPERAARVAKYVNLDGASADAAPGGVPTLAIWGQGSPEREITGAENVYFPDQTHTQVVTSPESFAAQYEFLVGTPPATTDVEPASDIEIAGRAVVFPENMGIDGATLEIWAVDGLTGLRTEDAPVARYTLDDVGAFGPLAVETSQQYEFLIRRPMSELQHHIYMQAFTRSNSLIRLLSVEPDSPIAQNIEGSPRHTTVTVIRHKEWWGGAAEGENDTLEINGTNVLNATTSPISQRTIGFHMFDRGSDGVSHVDEADPFFSGLPFQSGTDIYIPAEPPQGAVCLANAPRGDGTRLQVINVPNLRSSEHRISAEFMAFMREDDPPCGAAAEQREEPEPQLPSTGTGPARMGGAGSALTGAIALVVALLWMLGIARRLPSR
jgi:hypothetical protein